MKDHTIKSDANSVFPSVDRLQPSQCHQEEEGLELLFRDLFVSYEKGMHHLAMHLCKDPHVASDIVHDVFVKLWEIRHQLHEIKSIESFLFTLTKNRVLDHLRKVASDQRLKQAIWESMQDGVREETVPEIEAREFHVSLKRAIDHLPPQRKIIYLMRDEGYDYKQIAEKLNISRHTVKNQISSALKSIRKMIGRSAT